MLAEQQTEWIISNNLVNKAWVVDGENKLKNVYFQKPKTAEQRNKLQGKKPDYILYQTGSDQIIAIIEAKKYGSNLEVALKQATEYAKLLDCPLIFATNGAYCETRFVASDKELILNGEEVRELLREKEILAFLEANNNEAWTIPLEVKLSREKLISIFKNLNDVLRAEGIRAGIERFSEFANILFLKLLSENDSKSWWHSIKGQANDDIIGYINSHVMGQIQAKYGGDVFTPISIKNPSTLRHIIDAIDPLILSTIDSDIKGDAFEYFLEKTTSTENDLGEYFTPRNIVRTIINIIEPKFGETIYDPFCGTGGFLTESFNYIKENTIIKNPEELTTLKHHTLYGREITTTARIAKMNMILHGDGHSGVQQLHSLENPDYYVNQATKESIKFDVIVTNIPFSQDITKKIMQNGKTVKENHIAPLYYSGLAKNNGDAICVLHALRNLKEGGRMALVVPEGFLFRKTLANVRQFLLSKAKLQAVISLPQGVFLPYTGVKTDILYFTDAHKANNQKEYWFYEVANIGFTLDNHKRKIKGINDLDKIESSDINRIDKKPQLQDKMLELGFELVNMEKVKNNHYSLVGKIYRKEKSYNGEWKMVKLGEVCDFLSGYAFKSDNFSIEFEHETLPVVRIGDIQENSESIELKESIYHKRSNFDQFLVKKGDLLISMTGAKNNGLGSVGKVGIYNLAINALLNQRVGRLRPKSNINLSIKYIWYILQFKKFRQYCHSIARGSVQSNISEREILDFIIHLPPLHMQQQIIAELDSYTKIIGGLQQAIDGWKPYFGVDKSWEVKKFHQYFNLQYGKSLVEDKRIKGIYPVIGSNGICGYHNEYITNAPCIVIGRKGGAGKVLLIEQNCFPIDTAFYLEWDSQEWNHLYIYYFLQTLCLEKLQLHTTIPSISRDDIYNIEIIKPPLHIQQQIVEELETQRKMIEKYKEDIKYFEDKIKNKLNSLWQDDSNVVI